ncbi:MAG: outer membrane beta-barrel protein [Draconibacterium sp.]
MLDIAPVQIAEGYFEVGNPNLKPELRHEIPVTANLKWLSLLVSFNYTFSNNHIGPLIYQDVDGNTLKTYANNSKYKVFSLQLSKNFMKMGSMNNTIVTLMPLLTSNTINGESTQMITVIGFINGSYMIMKKLRIGYNLSYTQLFSEGYYSTHTSRPIDGKIFCSYSWKRAGNTFLKISANANILGWGESNRTITYSTSQYKQTSHSVNRRLPFTVDVAMFFGNFKVKPVRGFQGSVEIGGYSSGS